MRSSQLAISNDYYNTNEVNFKPNVRRNPLKVLKSLKNSTVLIYENQFFKIYKSDYYKDFLDEILQSYFLNQKSELYEIYEKVIKVLRRGKKDILCKKIEDKRLRRPSYLYQYLASLTLNVSDVLYLFFEMGLGKSKVIVDSINLNENINKVLIVVPAHLLKEIEKKIYEDLTRDLTVKIIYPGNYLCLDKKERYRVVLDDLMNENNVIHIISYQYLGQIIKNNYENPELIKKINERVKVFDLVVYDEAHYFKNEKSLNYEVAQIINLMSARRIISTGTPYAKDIKDVINIVENPIKRIELKNNSGECEEIYKLFKNNCFFLKSEDVHNLPKLNIVEIKVEANKKVRKKYIKVLKERDRESRMQKLLQLNSFFMYTDYGYGDYQVFGKEKIERLEKLIKEEFKDDQIIVIWYLYKAEEEELSKYLRKKFKKYRIVVLDRDYENGVSLSEYVSGQKSILLLQIQKFAEGLNLQEYGINKMIFYNLTYDYVKYKQALKRIHRIGQEKECYVYILNTYIDGKPVVNVLENLKRKEKQSEILFEREEGELCLDIEKLISDLRAGDLINRNISEWKFSHTASLTRRALNYDEERILKQIRTLTANVKNQNGVEDYLSQIENILRPYLGVYLSETKFKVAKNSLIRKSNCLKYYGYVYEFDLEKDRLKIKDRYIFPYRCKTIICKHCQSYLSKYVYSQNLAFFETDLVKKFGASFLTLTYKRIPYLRAFSGFEQFKNIYNLFMDYRISYNDLDNIESEGIVEIKKHYRNILDKLSPSSSSSSPPVSKKEKILREQKEIEKEFKLFIKRLKNEMKKNKKEKDFRHEFYQYIKAYEYLLEAIKFIYKYLDLSYEEIVSIDKRKKMKLNKDEEVSKFDFLIELNNEMKKYIEKIKYYEKFLYPEQYKKFARELFNVLIKKYKKSRYKSNIESLLVYSLVSDIVESLKCIYVNKLLIKELLFMYIADKNYKKEVDRLLVKVEIPPLRLTELLQGIYRLEMTYKVENGEEYYYPHIHALVTSKYAKSKVAKYLLIVIAKRVSLCEVLKIDDVNLEDKESLSKYLLSDYNSTTIETGPNEFVIAYCLAYMKKVRIVGEEFKKQWKKAFYENLLKEVSDLYVFIYNKNIVRFEYDRKILMTDFQKGKVCGPAKMIVEDEFEAEGQIIISQTGKYKFIPNHKDKLNYNLCKQLLDGKILGLIEKIKSSYKKNEYQYNYVKVFTQEDNYYSKFGTLLFETKGVVFLKDLNILIVNKKKVVEKILEKAIDNNYYNEINYDFV